MPELNVYYLPQFVAETELAGSVVIEWIFQIPGFGQLMINSIFNKDYNVVMGISLISAFLTLVGLLIADILYAAVDPRVSYE